MRKWNLTFLVRVVFWAIIIVLGASAAWVDRHAIHSDGISYVEIATHYAHGDWWNALNAYWSPLLSWAIALAFWLLRPSPYWQVATVHLIIFSAYVAGFVALDLLVRELILFPSNNSDRSPLLPEWVLYMAGYGVMLFATLSMISMWFCYPDMLALALTLFLIVIMLRIRRTGGSNGLFVLFGAVCALLYFARTAFIAPMILCIAIVLILLAQRGSRLLRPGLVTVATIVLLTAPYIYAISKKDGRFTVGNSGMLNLAWEICGARRWVHWQGEPGDIGAPKHPTTLAVSLPATYTFAQPVAATYPPWYDPSYWYAGVKPRLEIKPILQALLVNLSIFGNALIRSPIFFPVLFLVPFMGFRRWLGWTFELWPVLLPMLGSIGFYALLYIERRYIAANLLIIWMALLFTVRLSSEQLRRWAAWFIAGCTLLFFVAYVGNRQRYTVKAALSDLVHRRERFQNIHWLLAQQFRSMGLCPGDKVAYLGPGMHAEWARLDGVRVVAEVPLTYSRNRSFLNNLEIDNPDQVEAFFKTDEAGRQRVLDAFRKVGAKMLVTDGFYSEDFVKNWPRVLPAQDPHLPEWSKEGFSQLNTRYLWLVPEHSSCASSGLL